MVGIGPGGQLHGRMEHVVEALDDDRAGPALDGENAFHAQQVIRVGGADAAEPKVEAGPMERGFGLEGDGGDAGAVAVGDVEAGPVGADGVGDGGARAGGVEEGGGEEGGRVDGAVLHRDDAGGRVELAEAVDEGGGVGKVGFGDEASVGEFGLGAGFGVLLQLLEAEETVDHGDDGFKPHDAGEGGLAEDGLGDGGRGRRGRRVRRSCGRIAGWRRIRGG